MIFITPTQIQEIKLDIHNPYRVKLFIKREDLIHNIVSGNKWRKLKYNFKYIMKNNIKTILSFGGAYSNHLHALSWLAKENNVKSIGLVRGEEIYKNNPTLTFCTNNNMELYFLDRKTYRESKFDNKIINDIKKNHKNSFIIPEGGLNQFGIKGCEEIMTEVEGEFNIICSSIGSGCTAIGLIKSLKANQSFLGLSSFKNSDLINQKIKSHVSFNSNWSINSDYNFGGFGKVNSELKSFMSVFEKNHKITLDPVYNSKTFFGLLDMISKKRFPKESRILVLHTGGLQGLQGIKTKNHEA